MKQRYNTNANDIERYHTFDSLSECSEYACLMRFWFQLGDQVRLLPLCMTEPNSTEESSSLFVNMGLFNSHEDCPFRSNSLILVVSVAHHISADEYSFNTGEFGLIFASRSRSPLVEDARSCTFV